MGANDERERRKKPRDSVLEPTSDRSSSFQPVRLARDSRGRSDNCLVVDTSDASSVRKDPLFWSEARDLLGRSSSSSTRETRVCSTMKINPFSSKKESERKRVRAIDLVWCVEGHA